MDLLAEVADEILYRGGRLIVLGQGDHDIETALKSTAARFPGRMAVSVCYNEQTAHQIHGGSDAIIQPSRFEPCGLGQMIAMRYGAVPVVSRTGGLGDTVRETEAAGRPANGFLCAPGDGADLARALDRALDARKTPAWEALVQAGMSGDFSWDRSVESYLALYRRVAGA